MTASAPRTPRWTELVERLRPVEKRAAALDAFRFEGFRASASDCDFVLRFLPGRPRIGLAASARLAAAPPRRALHVMGRLARSLDALGPALAALHEAQERPARLRLNVDDVGGRDGLCFDRPAGSDWPLLPDLYLLRHVRSARPVPQRDPAAAAAEFTSRRPVLFWRGATTGGVIRSLDDLATNPRVRACLLAREQLAEHADCRVVEVTAAPALVPEAEAWLAARDLSGPRVPQAEFARHRMTLDLAGHAAAWGSYARYLEGTLVLRVAHGRELFYYPMLKPWTHYVPVAADLGDLRERAEWALANTDQAARIAQAGHELMAGLLEALPALTLDALRAALRPG
ncbi:glycosyl transferase family 90 [Falsiroseomonas sp. HW251]|uniref:glycosyl transferase family 90 n=1 Tax=Falsiroseomonas sp. HW251 TaxID=3390998 RepID=UPI003D31FAE1